MAGRCNNCHTWSQWQVETQLRQTDFAAMLDARSVFPDIPNWEVSILRHWIVTVNSF